MIKATSQKDTLKVSSRVEPGMLVGHWGGYLVPYNSDRMVQTPMVYEEGLYQHCIDVKTGKKYQFNFGPRLVVRGTATKILMGDLVSVG